MPAELSHCLQLQGGLSLAPLFCSVMGSGMRCTNATWKRNKRLQYKMKDWNTFKNSAISDDYRSLTLDK